MKRRVIFVLSMLLTVIFLSSSVVAQTSTSKSSSNASNTVDSSNSSTGISVFGFIEKIAGQRDFFISTKLTFDMIDGAERKVFTVSFDMQIDNLEDFVFYLKGPEILKGIIIEYNMVTGKVDYTYDNSKASQSLVSDVNQISGIIQSITDFLSTNVRYKRGKGRSRIQAEECTNTHSVWCPANSCFIVYVQQCTNENRDWER